MSNLNLSYMELTELPHGLDHEWHGNFRCVNNKLTSLKGCPGIIRGSFDCGINDLTTLEYCATHIHRGFSCMYNNKMTSLHDVHSHISHVGGSIILQNTPIQSHILGLMLIDVGSIILTGLGKDISPASSNVLVMDVDVILNKWKNLGRRGVMGAMKELLDLGYDDLAQL